MMIGSLAIISIALKGAGWSEYSICSKRGFEAGAGRGFWFVDQSSALFGACGTFSVIVGFICGMIGGRGADFCDAVAF